jgi:hypothetical protein
MCFIKSTFVLPYYVGKFSISDVHKIRPHKGQGEVAKRLRSLLHSETFPSEIARKIFYKKTKQDKFRIGFKTFLLDCWYLGNSNYIQLPGMFDEHHYNPWDRQQSHGHCDD